MLLLYMCAMLVSRGRAFTSLRILQHNVRLSSVVTPHQPVHQHTSPSKRIQQRLHLSTKDASAFSKSRAPFSIPKAPKGDGDDDSKQTWAAVGLWPHVAQHIQEEMGFEKPTPVQQLAIPAILKDDSHISFLAATGSGKTLAYSLPLLQLCKLEDLSATARPSKRPRVLILAPTRELVVQITSVVKNVCHGIKLSCASGIYGSSKVYGQQRQDLDRPIDIVVATPGRLLKHWKDNNIFLSRVTHIVLDEMDTMVEQGFAGDLRKILYPIMYHKQGDQKGVDPAKDLREDAPKLIFTSATMTQAIQKIVGDDQLVTAKKHHRRVTEETVQTLNKPLLLLPKMKVLKVSGLHQTVPQLKQVFIDVGGSDKLDLLIDLLASEKASRTMIFCNTAASCRAVQFAMSEVSMPSLAYHGELNSAVRLENLKEFRKEGSQAALVCTDLAARGLDIPQVDHVILFDFPLNPLDYLHRTGRTARQGQRGKVSALVAKRDMVLANAIEQAVRSGKAIDGLSSRKSDYQPGSAAKNKGKPKRFNIKKSQNTRGPPTKSGRRRRS